MMNNYENPQPTEGINVSEVHPLKTFFKLFTAIILILVASAWFLGKSGSWLASLIPYQKEIEISNKYMAVKASTEADQPADETSHQEIQNYLQTRVNQLEPYMDLPKGMHITVHYEAEDVENAFAALGGHIFMYKGLLDKLPNENSLAMLLAHEMSHVKLRHPIRAAGQSMAISVGIKYLLGYSDIGLLGKTGLYTQLTFSRAMESVADREGLLAVYKTYGTVSGAVDLFEILHQLQLENGEEASTPFFSTHPLDEKRINDLNALAKENKWDKQKKTTELPEKFNDWL